MNDLLKEEEVFFDTHQQRTPEEVLELYLAELYTTIKDGVAYSKQADQMEQSALTGRNSEILNTVEKRSWRMQHENQEFKVIECRVKAENKIEERKQYEQKINEYYAIAKGVYHTDLNIKKKEQYMSKVEIAWLRVTNIRMRYSHVKENINYEN